MSLLTNKHRAAQPNKSIRFAIWLRDNYSTTTLDGKRHLNKNRWRKDFSQEEFDVEQLWNEFEKQDNISSQSDVDGSLLLAVEFGYKQCEKGNNLQIALSEFNKTVNFKGA